MPDKKWDMSWILTVWHFDDIHVISMQKDYFKLPIWHVIRKRPPPPGMCAKTMVNVWESVRFAV